MRPRGITSVLLAVPALAVCAAAAVPPASSAAPARASAAAASGNTDWLAYHGSRYRSGYDPKMPAYRGGLHVAKKVTLDGAVYASPIVARGLTILATENDTVYAFGPRNRLVWKRHLGTPAPSSALPCGDINPLGITGTPVYWGPSGIVYVAAEFANPVRHRLFALRVSNGTIASNRGLDFKGVETRAMQERGALTITGGRVWVPFGGLAGDCGGYKGRVVGYPIGRAGAAVRYTVPTAREAGIWTPPGPNVDSRGNLLVAVGNGASGVGDRYDYSDSVLKISPRARRVGFFSPATWATDNDNDLDLGSQGPAIVANKWVFQAGKSGTVYVLHLAHLGGIGGAVSRRRSVCTSFGGTAVVGTRVYVPCTDGVRAFQIGPRGWPTTVWHAAGSITGSPVVGGGVVWALDTDAGVLHALGTAHGGSRAAVSVGGVSRFATPALSGRRVIVGTMSGFTVVTY